MREKELPTTSGEEPAQASSRERQVALALGDGGGGFAPAPGSPLGTVRPRPYAVMLGDVDRDGALDVVAAHDDTDEVSVSAAHGASQQAGWLVRGGRPPPV